MERIDRDPAGNSEKGALRSGPDATTYWVSPERTTTERHFDPFIAKCPFLQGFSFDNCLSLRVNSKFSLLEVNVMESNYAEENLSTEQPPTRQKARLSRTHGDQERACGHQATPSKRTQTINGSPLLGLSLPKDERLRKRADFLRVYDQGRRFEGRFMTVFILPAELGVHRLGVTATKKAIGNAVARNRAKRLLREAFRLSRAELDMIETKFDWVLNARRSLLYVKLEKPLGEFRAIAAKIKGGIPSDGDAVPTDMR